MKPFRITKFIFLSLCSLIAPSTQLFAQDAADIMFKVDKVENFSYNSSVRTIKFSTCQYAVDQGRMYCTDNPRIVIIESVHKDYFTPKKEKDAKSIDVIISPIADKGTGMLVWKYADQGEDSDFWLYLPALGKVKRIASKNEGSETGSVFGTEFSIEDATYRKLKDYTYKYLGDDTYNGRPAWMIESIPTAQRAKKTFYSKVISWIDKERYIILKEDLYDHNGKQYKQLATRKVEQIDGIWIVTKTSMNNLSTHRVTNYDTVSIGFNMEIDDEFFTQRVLTDFAYREKNMVKYRTYLK